MSNTAGTAVTTTTAAAEQGADVERADRPELLDVTLRWSDLGLFVACYVAMVVVWVGLGELIVRSDSIEARDQSVAEWFVDSRTATLDTLSALGSNLADTMVKIAVTAVLAIVMRLVWKRWREPLMMVVPLVLEASVFITVTYLVARPRPDVERLESSPVDSSFPSGHVAAAAAYGALVIIVYWHVRNRLARALVIALSVAIPVIVGWARMYRGMHHLTDVLAGVLLGIVSVALSWWMIHRAIERTRSSSHAIG
ncbi:MAG: phosphatase PAP2 family protein [Ilumatobacteraceae bacterium]